MQMTICSDSMIAYWMWMWKRRLLRYEEYKPTLLIHQNDDWFLWILCAWINWTRLNDRNALFLFLFLFRLQLILILLLATRAAFLADQQGSRGLGSIQESVQDSVSFPDQIKITVDLSIDLDLEVIHKLTSILAECSGCKQASCGGWIRGAVRASLWASHDRWQATGGRQIYDIGMSQLTSS